MGGLAFGRTLRTAADVPPRQLGWRAVRAVRQAVPTWAGPVVTTSGGRGGAVHRSAADPPDPAGWPASFLPLDAVVSRSAGQGGSRSWSFDARALDRGQITLLGHTVGLGHTVELGRPAGVGDQLDWSQRSQPRLWRFHLHGWTWAWDLAAWPETDRARSGFARLYRCWRAQVRPGHPDAWSPHPAALRAWTLCGLPSWLVADVASELRVDLPAHQRFLRRNLERDLGGNHLLADLKALVGLGVWTRDREGARRWSREFAEAADRQALPDGGHVERSPAYHLGVLADATDVVSLLDAARQPVPGELHDVVRRMTAWLGVMAGPGRTLPASNDGYDPGAELLRTLLDAPVAGEPARARSGLLAPSGFAVLDEGALRVVADVGSPRRGVAGHAHAGTLAFQLDVAGQPVVVDTGTSTYDPGPRRDYERSTAAHATVVVDGQDSTEVWGGFRVGRRARVGAVSLVRRPGLTVLAAEHDGYRHLPGAPVHRRRWELRADRVTIVDVVDGEGDHDIEVVFPLAPAVRVRPAGDRLAHLAASLEAGFVLRFDYDGPGCLAVRPARCALGWQRTAPHSVVVFRLRARAPAVVVSVLEVAGRPTD